MAASGLAHHHPTVAFRTRPTYEALPTFTLTAPSRAVGQSGAVPSPKSRHAAVFSTLSGLVVWMGAVAFRAMATQVGPRRSRRRPVSLRLCWEFKAQEPSGHRPTVRPSHTRRASG